MTKGHCIVYQTGKPDCLPLRHTLTYTQGYESDSPSANLYIGMTEAIIYFGCSTLSPAYACPEGILQITRVSKPGCCSRILPNEAISYALGKRHVADAVLGTVGRVCPITDQHCRHPKGHQVKSDTTIKPEILK